MFETQYTGCQNPARQHSMSVKAHIQQRSMFCVQSLYTNNKINPLFNKNTGDW